MHSECFQNMTSVEVNTILKMAQDVRKYFPEPNREFSRVLPNVHQRQNNLKSSLCPFANSRSIYLFFYHKPLYSWLG